MLSLVSFLQVPKGIIVSVCKILKNNSKIKRSLTNENREFKKGGKKERKKRT